MSLPLPPQPALPPTDAEPPPRSPRSPGELFRVFNRLSLQGFGGVLPIAQRELVERERWLTRETFVELLSVGQVLPGPNIVNLALMYGDRCFGLRGAFAALGGLLAVPLALVLLLAALFGRLSEQPQLAGAVRGMGIVAAGLVLATALRLAGSLKGSPLGSGVAVGLMAATVLAIAAMRWPLAAVLAALGPLGVGLAWRRLGR